MLSFAIGRNDHRIRYWFMTKSEAVNKMKKSDLSEKSGQLLKKYVIVVMEINALEAMTQQQRYHEKQRKVHRKKQKIL